MTPPDDDASDLFTRPYPPPAVPAGFADRVTRAAVRDRLRRRTLRVFAGSGLAAAACLTLAAWRLTPEPVGSPRPVAARPTPVAKPFAEAGSAFVALSKQAADRTFAPAVNLFGGGDTTRRLTPPGSPAGVRPALADATQAARAGLEPVADATRRAVRLFVRDVGGAAGRKTDS